MGLQPLLPLLPLPLRLLRLPLLPLLRLRLLPMSLLPLPHEPSPLLLEVALRDLQDLPHAGPADGGGRMRMRAMRAHACACMVCVGEEACVIFRICAMPALHVRAGACACMRMRAVCGT